eukprot:3933990-Rhodomonas_salina.3
MVLPLSSTEMGYGTTHMSMALRLYMFLRVWVLRRVVPFAYAHKPALLHGLSYALPPYLHTRSTYPRQHRIPHSSIRYARTPRRIAAYAMPVPHTHAMSVPDPRHPPAQQLITLYGVGA